MLTVLAALLIAQAHVHGADAGAASDKDSKVPAHQPHPLDAKAPQPTGSMTKLQVGGEASQAYVARPKGKAQGALLMIHEWWGVNDWVKHEADQLAGQGYLALAIDLYKGKVAKDPKEAQAMMGAKDEKWGDQVEEAGLEWLKKNAGGAKVATIGWCMGGGQSLNASLASPGKVSATVVYYGLVAARRLGSLLAIQSLGLVITAAVGAWMSDESSGTWITGRSLSGIEMSRGTSGLSSSVSGTRYTWATSAGFGESSTCSPAQATTGVMRKPERVP